MICARSSERSRASVQASEPPQLEDVPEATEHGAFEAEHASAADVEGLGAIRTSFAGTRSDRLGAREEHQLAASRACSLAWPSARLRRRRTGRSPEAARVARDAGAHAELLTERRHAHIAGAGREQRHGLVRRAASPSRASGRGVAERPAVGAHEVGRDGPSSRRSSHLAGMRHGGEERTERGARDARLRRADGSTARDRGGEAPVEISRPGGGAHAKSARREPVPSRRSDWRVVAEEQLARGSSGGSSTRAPPREREVAVLRGVLLRSQAHRAASAQRALARPRARAFRGYTPRPARPVRARRRAPADRARPDRPRPSRSGPSRRRPSERRRCHVGRPRHRSVERVPRSSRYR